ncbi:alpha/beta hydrolase-fold protein, partial [Bacteroidota bacterium]
LMEELFPYVEKYYRTEPHRLLIGHSLGGLFAIHTLIENNELFNLYIAPSPALLHVDSVITADYPSKLRKLTGTHKSIYFTIGGEESSETISCATNLQNVFIRNAPAEINWKFNFMENDNHTSLIFNSIYEGLLMVYKGWEVPVTTAKEGIDAVIQHYDDLSVRFEFKIQASAHKLNAIGKKLVNQKAYESAINLLQKGVELFPESAPLENNLGVVYEYTGQLKLAKESYDNACTKAAMSREPYYALYVENLNNVLSKLDNKKYKKVFEAQLL